MSALAIAPCGAAKAWAFQASPSRARAHQRHLHVVCSAAKHGALDRRAVLSGLGAAVTVAAAPLLAIQPAVAAASGFTERAIPVESLTAFQKADLIADFIKRATAELGKVLTAADAPAAVRLLLNDVSTFDAADPSSGGVDGSIILPEELDRPENKDLKPLVEKLAKAKAAVDAQGAERGQQPISWADTIVLAAKVGTEAAWAVERQQRASTPEGKRNSLMFPNPIAVRVGRIDATEPAPAGRVPAPGTSIEEIRAFFTKFGNKPGSLDGPFPKLPLFNDRVQYLIWTAAQPDPVAAEAALVASDPTFDQWKKKYDTSKRTVTRTDYEVDFGEKLSLLSNLGTKFNNKTAYLYPLKFNVPIKL